MRPRFGSCFARSEGLRGRARLTAPGLSDYFLRETAEQAEAELRLLYAQPVTGRQLIQARLERNQALGGGLWALPRIEVVRGKSVRGHVAVSADAGFRLTAERTQALTEIATAFFPRKLPGIQAAFRISEAAWQASVRVQRQPQSLQADALHLFSIGEGVAYGSSVINYVVSGAPVSTFRCRAFSTSISTWSLQAGMCATGRKTTNGYLVQLHSGVLGPYTLLATYERPFKAQGETLAFTGARPLDVQSEQGHTLVISAYQFQVQTVDLSPGLLALEAGEVPPEYPLALRRPDPGGLSLHLAPLQSPVGSQPAGPRRFPQPGGRPRFAEHNHFQGWPGADRCALLGKESRASVLPVNSSRGPQLWSASVNGAPVVPVTNAKDNFIPLPQRADPNAVLQLDLKLAARSSSASRVLIPAPRTAAPGAARRVEGIARHRPTTWSFARVHSARCAGRGQLRFWRIGACVHRRRSDQGARVARGRAGLAGAGCARLALDLTGRCSQIQRSMGLGPRPRSRRLPAGDGRTGQPGEPRSGCFRQCRARAGLPGAGAAGQQCPDSHGLEPSKSAGHCRGSWPRPGQLFSA